MVGCFSGKPDPNDEWNGAWDCLIYIYALYAALALLSLLSYLPQPILNQRRRSTEGLSPEWALWLVVGTAYRLLAASLVTLSNHTVRLPFGGNTGWLSGPYWGFWGGGVLVLIYELIATSITLAQTALLPHQRPLDISPTSRTLLWGCVATTAGSLMAMALSNNGAEKFGREGWSGDDFVSTLNLVTILASLCKYVPQARLNRQRKSTNGFSKLQIWFDAVAWLPLVAMWILTAIRELWRGGGPRIGMQWLNFVCSLGSFAGDGWLLWQWWRYRGGEGSGGRSQVEGEEAGERAPLLR
ncbi:hypothetical protein B0A48_01136 [Cryoendolithus antarcticus]|uniref:Uncharacterized protein n=1 Tax=Cryoendolithus antarcticus TaxID=1507870 RepID=A0A1V8TSD1_9PEZI|nr:hypothetical protein B0A48_01136 [Cryoendolithus antarcticus]